jgi:hypothetical protein
MFDEIFIDVWRYSIPVLLLWMPFSQDDYYCQRLFSLTFHDKLIVYKEGHKYLP